MQPGVCLFSSVNLQLGFSELTSAGSVPLALHFETLLETPSPELSPLTPFLVLLDRDRQLILELVS